jgi:hypothetical protein
VEAANYALVPPDRERTLLGFEIPIVVTVDHITNRFGGPAVPDDPAPTPIPPTSPTDPTHLSTHVLVTAVGIGAALAPEGPPPGDPTGGNVSVMFTMPTAIIGDSAAYTVRTGTFIRRVTLTAATGPTGSPLTVQARRNGTVFTTLTIPDGTTTPQTVPLDIAVEDGDLLAVTAVSVGSTPATGVEFQIDLNDD